MCDYDRANKAAIRVCIYDSQKLSACHSPLGLSRGRPLKNPQKSTKEHWARTRIHGTQRARWHKTQTQPHVKRRSPAGRGAASKEGRKEGRNAVMRVTAAREATRLKNGEPSSSPALATRPIRRRSGMERRSATFYLLKIR